MQATIKKTHFEWPISLEEHPGPAFLNFEAPKYGAELTLWTSEMSFDEIQRASFVKYSIVISHELQ